MLLKSFFSAAASVAAVASAANLPPIQILGNKFYYSNNGSQFLMKGIAYQQDTVNVTSGATFVDPLGDYSVCSRDIPYMQQLQTNVIRVYALNVSLDHTQCMNALADAGIYVIADLSQPDKSINRDNPEWNVDLLARYTAVVDQFANYTNVLGFFAGNEVTNRVNNTGASAYVKAAIRDTKAYIKKMNYRNIPVGYSANDDAEIRVDLADYFACGNSSVRADFFGINMYEWCGKSTFQESGYANITSQYQNLGIPIFFSEYGCNIIQPRTFQEVQAIYGPNMTNIWSGGIVYMYFEEANNYGLVTISSGSVSTLADFNNLKTQLASVSPTLASINTASTSASVTTCPSVGPFWAANTGLPPTPDAAICNCMVDSLSCVLASGVSSDDYASLFSYICGVIDCSGVTGNATTGNYGAYSPCSDQQKLNFVLDLYYKSQNKNSNACNFSGSATLQSATTASSCAGYLASAGASGKGTVSGVIASGTPVINSGGSGSTSGSKASSNASLTSSKKSGAVSNKSGMSGFFVSMVVMGSLIVGSGLILV